VFGECGFEYLRHFFEQSDFRISLDGGLYVLQDNLVFCCFRRGGRSFYPVIPTIRNSRAIEISYIRFPRIGRENYFARGDILGLSMMSMRSLALDLVSVEA